jgi:glucose-1-phosphate adenylyltransferase
LDNTQVHHHAVVENAILDKDVAVLAGATVGVDKEHDRARGFTVSAGGVTVVSKGQVVTP